MLFDGVTTKIYSYDSELKKDGLLRQPIACHEIAKRTYEYVMIYVRNRTINMTLVMLFLVGNKGYYALTLLLLSFVNVSIWLRYKISLYNVIMGYETGKEARRSLVVEHPLMVR